MTHIASDERRLLRTMYVGMALTALLMLAPLVDVLTADSISSHVRDAYPQWPARKVHQDRDAIVAWLALVGLLGLGAWYWAIRSVRRHSGRMRLVVTTAFAMGLIAVMTNLSVGGDGYQQVVPLLYGLLWLIPAAVGLVAVIGAWRRPTHDGATYGDVMRPRSEANTR